MSRRSDRFDPLHDRPYNTVRCEIQRRWRALRRAGQVEAAALLRDFDHEDLREHGVDPLDDDPNQLALARALCREYLDLDAEQRRELANGRLRI